MPSFISSIIRAFRSKRRSGPPPLSVQELSQRAESFEYSDRLPMRFWLRTAGRLNREAQSYQRQGNDEQAFLFYFRFCKLVLDLLPFHPEAEQYEWLYRHCNLVLDQLPFHPDAIHNELGFALTELENEVPEVLRRLERLKPRITRRYEKYQKKLLKEAARGGYGPAVHSPPPMAADEHWAEGVKMFREDKSRRLGLTVSEEEAVAYLKGAEGVFLGEWQGQFSRPFYEVYDEEAKKEEVKVSEDLRELLEEAGRLLEATATTNGSRRRKAGTQHRLNVSSEASKGPEGSKVSRPSSSGSFYSARDHLSEANGPTAAPEPQSPRVRETAKETVTVTVEGNYPTVPKPQTAAPAPMRNANRVPTPFPPSSSVLPPARGIPKGSRTARRPPPKVVVVEERVPATAREENTVSRSGSLPPRRHHHHHHHHHHHQHQLRSSPVVVPEGALRKVIVPRDLRRKFLECVEDNTHNNIETMGFLCGEQTPGPDNNALVVSKLFIPKQRGSSEMCEPTDEGEDGLLEFCGENNVVLGWIHTHPSQTCFMSSRDCHTHKILQIDRAESIAIVCAPNKSPSWGIFRLTDPPGIQVITACHNPATFHRHEIDEDQIYEKAYMPGHVEMSSEVVWEVKDQRWD